MERIVCDQAILGGKPVIKGTRIAVYLILDLLSEGYSMKDINKLYPHIANEDIKACVTYAAQLCQVGEIAEPFGAIGNA
jgi:uncharacterized protein (DUF433 family)